MEKEQKYEKLLVKNESRTKNIIKIDVDQSKGHILQICNSDTRLQIDNISVGENNLRVTGKIRATIIYISSDDIYSICCQTKETDFGIELILREFPKTTNTILTGKSSR